MNKRYSPLALNTYTHQALVLCDSKIATFLQSMSLQRSIMFSCESERLYLSVQRLAIVFPNVSQDSMLTFDTVFYFLILLNAVRILTIVFTCGKSVFLFLYAAIWGRHTTIRSISTFRMFTDHLSSLENLSAGFITIFSKFHSLLLSSTCRYFNKCAEEIYVSPLKRFR